MRFDINNQLADSAADINGVRTTGQTFTSAAPGNYSFDKGSVAADISIGRRMCVAFFPTANTATISVDVAAIQDSDSALGSPTVLASVSVLTANVVVGKPIVVDFPQGTMTERYLGIRVEAVGGGSVIGFAYIMPSDEVPQYKDFPKVVNAAV